MDRKLMHSVVGAALAGGLAMAPGTALARDMRGLGVGGNVTLGGLSGLALDAWLSPDLALEIMAATGLSFPRNLLGGDAYDAGFGTDVGFSLGIAGGVFAVVAEGPDTNFEVGARLAFLGQFNTTYAGGAEDDRFVIELDVPALRVEHFFDAHFAINAQVGLAISIVPETPGGSPEVGGVGLGATSGLFGGAGFAYYFEGAPGRSAAPSGGPDESGDDAPRGNMDEERPPMPDPESGAAGW